MRKLELNKKADEKVLSIYWFVILIIITIGIVSATLHVFGSNIDIREAEAGLLKEKIIDCLLEKGLLNSNFEKLKSGDDENLLDICKIDLEDRTEKYRNTEQYGIKINEKEFGEQNLFIKCVSGEAKCIETKIYVLGSGKEFLEIKTAVVKKEKNED